MVRALMVACLVSLLPSRAWAQAAVPTSIFPTTPSGPLHTALFEVGPFLVTPTFHVGTLGVDTNVFYTPTERQTDFHGSGGPGLDIVLPLGRVLQFETGGILDYTYFVKTESQRKLAG